MAFWVENRTSLVKLGQSFSLLTRPERKHRQQFNFPTLSSLHFKIQADLGKANQAYILSLYHLFLCLFVKHIFKSRRL